MSAGRGRDSSTDEPRPSAALRVASAVGSLLALSSLAALAYTAAFTERGSRLSYAVGGLGVGLSLAGIAVARRVRG